MSRRPRPSSFLAATLSLSGVLGCGGQARAVDHVLVIGGGPMPESNQLSLERNVTFLLDGLGDDVRTHVYFADGDDPGRDLRTFDAGLEVAPARELLAILFGESDGLRATYRDHRVPQVDGPATAAAVDEWFETFGPTLGEGDRLSVYVTGHGDAADDEETPRNTYMLLWEDGFWSVREFAERLDRLDPRVPVTVVSVDCYCGGFADLIYRGGDPENGLAEADRCGFFATTHDRPAAGCSDEPDGPAAEYSLPFFSATFGRSPKGSTVTGSDLDGDGRVSTAEAHAFAVTHLETIDVPVRTSEEFALRQGEEIERSWSAADRDAADAVTRHAVTGLCTRLGLADDASLPAALTRRLDEIAGRIETLEAELEDATVAVDDAMFDIEGSVLRRWPELAGIWHPAVPRLIDEEGDAVVAAIAGHPLWREVEDLDEKIATLDERLLTAEREEAALLRVGRLLDFAAAVGTLDGESAETVARLMDAESAAPFGLR